MITQKQAAAMIARGSPNREGREFWRASIVERGYKKSHADHRRQRALTAKLAKAAKETQPHFPQASNLIC
jgi:hypothetical protein